MNNFEKRVILEGNDSKTIRSFVLRGGRLTNLQERALQNYYNDYVIEFSRNNLNFEKLFGSKNPVIIEIGFGMGESTAEIAERFPENNYLGIEVFLAGVGRLLHDIHERGLNNLRIIRFNAVDVLQEMISDQSAAGFHIFFPDPWPKKKHHKRRLLQEEFFKILSRKLKPGGYIYCVTDWTPYAEWIIGEARKVTELVNNSENGYCEPVSWRPETKFESKGITKKHTIHEIWLEKSGMPQQ